MSKYNVTLVFEDGRSERILADENDTIYMACLRNKIRILTDCLEGACATCKGVCVEGEYNLDDVSEEALSAEEAAQREVLTCQMHARSECIIELPYESRLAIKAETKSWTCRVDCLEDVSSTVKRLDLKIIGQEAGGPEFMPGQYVHLSVPGTKEKRSYSFATPPHETDTYQFFIKVLEQGAMSNYVRDRAKPGDEVVMTGPFGHFYLRNPERPILMVAGGTGLAPMLSMLDHMVERGMTSQRVHLLIGANVVEELFYLNLLEDYRLKGISLTTEVAVVEGNEAWTGETGHVTGLLRSELIAGRPNIYLCGPPPMIEAAESWLADNGVDDKLIHAEKFLAS